jgi:hypothetical protein
MKVTATIDPDGAIVAIAASPEDAPRLATVLLPGESQIELDNHDISDNDNDDDVHRKLGQLYRSYQIDVGRRSSVSKA